MPGTSGEKGIVKGFQAAIRLALAFAHITRKAGSTNTDATKL